jgi:hypothetical protein
MVAPHGYPSSFKLLSVRRDSSSTSLQLTSVLDRAFHLLDLGVKV